MTKKPKPEKYEAAFRKEFCPACKTAWSDHPGIIITCRRHQVALECLEQIAAIRRGGMCKRLAVATLSLLRHCKP